MAMEKNSVLQVEDISRQYRRYTRATRARRPPRQLPRLVHDMVLFLEACAWKEHFLVTVFHATNCVLRHLRSASLELEHDRIGLAFDALAL